MATELFNISIEGQSAAELNKKKARLHGVAIDMKRLDKDGADYKLHGLTIEKMQKPNLIIRTFDSSGNALAGVTITIGSSIGITNAAGYLYHNYSSELDNAACVASKTDYTSETVKISGQVGGSPLFQSFYLAPASGESAIVDKGTFRVSGQFIIKRTSTAGVKTYTKILRSGLSTSGNFSSSNVTEQALYDHFIALTDGTPAADKVALITLENKYKYIRRYASGGIKYYQTINRSSLDNVSNFNSSSHTEREIFDFMVEYLTGTNPSS